LAEYPRALLNVLDLLKASQWGAQYLTRHPHLLDHLLNSGTEKALIEQPEKYWRDVKTNLNMRLDDVMADGDSPEQAMDILRVTHHNETFITLLADLGIGVEKPLAVEKVSDHLSALADLMLQTTFERVWPGVSQKFGLPKDLLAPFAVISYGKLGGKELGYASDLDLVFLYQSVESDYAAQEIYALLHVAALACRCTAADSLQQQLPVTRALPHVSTLRPEALVQQSQHHPLSLSSTLYITRGGPAGHLHQASPQLLVVLSTDLATRTHVEQQVARGFGLYEHSLLVCSTAHCGVAGCCSPWHHQAGV
jgi:hypothetical protein